MNTDDLQHWILGLTVGLAFGWQVGTAVNVTLEATQANYYATNGGSYSSWDWEDTAQDLVVTEAGVLIGEIIRRKIKKKKLRPGSFIVFRGDTLYVRDNKLEKWKGK